MTELRRLSLKLIKDVQRHFFTLLKTDLEKSITFSFDCEKNLPLPKIPDQATYYSRQLYLFNFTMVEGTSTDRQPVDKVHIYTWTEADSHKGSSEIASAVYHRLNNTDLRNYEIVRLFADGCEGQNKNTTMIGMLMKWLHNAPHNIREVQLTFPIPGHSFIPPDRVFGRIEKQLKTMSTITKSEEYYTVFENSGQIQKIGRDFDVYNWKAATGDILKKPHQWHFRFAVCKRFIITRGATLTAAILVRGETAYNTDVGIARKVCRANRNAGEINPTWVKIGVPVKEEKIKDIQKLLVLHYGEGWENLPDLQFYTDIITSNCVRSESNISEDENEGGAMEDVEDME